MPKLLFAFLAASLLSTVLWPIHAKADEPLIANGSFTYGMEDWRLNVLEGATATSHIETTENGGHAIQIEVPRAEAKRWLVQLVHTGVQLHADKVYHLHFRARCKPAGPIAVMAASFHDKFVESWRQEGIAIGEKWTDCSCEIKPQYSDDDAQIIFSGLAAQAGDYWFADISMTTGE